MTQIDDDPLEPGIYIRGVQRGAYSCLEVRNSLPDDLDDVQVMLESVQRIESNAPPFAVGIPSVLLGWSADHRTRRHNAGTLLLGGNQVRALDLVVPQRESDGDGDKWLVMAADHLIRPELTAGNYLLSLTISARNRPSQTIPSLTLELGFIGLGAQLRQTNSCGPKSWVLVGGRTTEAASTQPLTSTGRPGCSTGEWSLIGEAFDVVRIDGSHVRLSPRQTAVLRVLHELKRPATNQEIIDGIGADFATSKVTDIFRPGTPAHKLLTRPSRGIYMLGDHSHEPDDGRGQSARA